MNTPVDKQPPPPIPAPRRTRALLILTALVALAGLGWAAYWALFERHTESTDNAYVQAPIVQVTPQMAGTVVAVHADDTDVVSAGTVLVRLESADARVAVQRAEAQLAQAVREVRTLFGNNATADASVRQRQAEVTRLRTDVAKAEEDLARRRPLLAAGVITTEAVQHAEAALGSARGALASAQQALEVAEQQAASGRLSTTGTTVEQHPRVAAAAAAVRETYLVLQRTELPAPVTGQVVRRVVQVGQRVAPGAMMMSLVPLEQAWVEANFKEVQLRHMRVGQPATVTADLYGAQVVYHGRVSGFGAGTGAAFALLPAQNATGNWIKIVQRVPVRIALDPTEVKAHPLRVGLSMQVSVDVAEAKGAAATPTAAAASAARADTQTHVFDERTEAIDRRVRQIIGAQLSGAPPPR